MFALSIYPGQSPEKLVGANELNFCVRDGREPERRRWRSKRGRSVRSGRRKASLLRQAPLLPGTASGNRWIPPVPIKKRKSQDFS